MKNIPETKFALVLRTDFSNDAAWGSIREKIQAPIGEFRAYVECVSDPAFSNISVEQILAQSAENSKRMFMFVVDQTTLSHPDRPILVIDLFWEPGRTFRVIPSEMWAVENNLTIANMDFAEFADSTDPDGVFRAFPI
jgi:hypothetical protein